MVSRKLYLFDGTTKEYTGFITQNESPLEPGKFFDVQNSTETEPDFSKLCSRTVLIFLDNKWVLLEDYRGQQVYDKEGTSSEVDWLGPIGGNLTTTPPIYVLKTLKKIEASEACSTAIQKGFYSSDIFYPSSTLDQHNILLSSFSGGKLWCKRDPLKWDFVLHSEEHAKKVLSDMITHIQSIQQKYADLLVKIEMSSSPEDLQIISRDLV